MEPEALGCVINLGACRVSEKEIYNYCVYVISPKTKIFNNKITYDIQIYLKMLFKKADHG